MLMSQGMNLYLAAYAVARPLYLVSALEGHVLLQIKDLQSCQCAVNSGDAVNAAQHMNCPSLCPLPSQAARCMLKCQELSYAEGKYHLLLASFHLNAMCRKACACCLCFLRLGQWQGRCRVQICCRRLQHPLFCEVYSPI